MEMENTVEVEALEAEGTIMPSHDYNAWKSLPILQQPNWPNPVELANVLEKVRSLPPLITPSEVDACRDKLAQVNTAGKYFIIQAGSCAERFTDCTAEIIQQDITLLRDAGNLFENITSKGVILIGRIAGQYAKPRSTDDAIYRGDIVNEFKGCLIPDARRLLEAYFHAAATLNFIRTLESNGVGNRNPVYTSHEALLLNCEDALTRKVGFGADKKMYYNYNLSAPFVWIGDRTRQLTHAHIHYAAHIVNPIGIKLGPSITPEELLELLTLIFSYQAQKAQPGKVTLITRLGADKVSGTLPSLVKAVQFSTFEVIWLCDPCHGNSTMTTTPIASGQGQRARTRYMDCMLDEVVESILIHKSLGSRLDGIHLEVTGQPVTECIGGTDVPDESALSESSYRTSCDPRLNQNQTLAFVKKVAEAYLQMQGR